MVIAGNSEDKSNVSAGESGEEMDMGDMDKLEQDAGNMGEVGHSDVNC